MIGTVLKVIGGMLAFLGVAWIHGTQEHQIYTQKKKEKLDELARTHFGKAFNELGDPPRNEEPS